MTTMMTAVVMMGDEKKKKNVSVKINNKVHEL